MLGEKLRSITQDITPKVPNSEMFDAVVVAGDLDKKSNPPRINSDTSMAVLTAGVIKDADVTHGIILTAPTQEGVSLMEDRLNEAFNLGDSVVSLETRLKLDENNAHTLKRILKKYPRIKRLGIITAMDPKKIKEFESSGISLNQIPPEDILNNKIAASAASSPQKIAQLMVGLGQHFLKYKKLMMGGIGLYEVGARA